jgi:hypothetical protein
MIGLKDFNGLSSLPYQKRSVMGVIDSFEGDTLMKLQTLKSMASGEFQMWPTFNYPNPENRLEREAFNKILGKRGRQTYSFATSDEVFHKYMPDKFICQVANFYIDSVNL